MRHLLKIIVVLSFLISCYANAALDLELTQGVQASIPIAVVPFDGQTDAQSPNNITSVVAADLANSGRFKVADPNSLQQQPHDAQGMDFTYWQQRHLDDVVVGSVIPVSGGRYQVTFQLVNIYAKNNPPDAGGNIQTPVLLSEKFTVPSSRLRSLAHHISDLVYEKLTGDRGVFSTKIAYVVVEKSGSQSRYTLQVADQDGYNPKALLTSNEPIMSPAWSPDARHIAYVSFEGGESAIYLQDIATGARRLMSKAPGINGAPAWSPDGRKLALVLTKSGSPKIYVMNLSSGQLQQITDGDSIDTEPDFSPNGNSLIFTSDRGGGPEIYQINLASRQIQRVTFNSDYNARASYTPDGQNIVMITRMNNGYNIAVQNLQSGQVTLLTSSGMAQSPTVAPNGKMVAFANEYDGRGVLGMASLDGNIKLRIPSEVGDVQEPAWSPFLN